MKKSILLAALLLAALGALAQDTVWRKTAPLDNYFYNNWLDTSEVIRFRFLFPNHSYVIAKQFVAGDETLEVYGIAAMMGNFESIYGFVPTSQFPDIYSYLAVEYPEDPTFDNCEESLLLYQYQGSPSPTMQQLGDSLHVHMLYTPISYWLMTHSPSASFSDTIPKPVYERYFSTPQTVSDTFYVGFTCSDGGFSKVDSIWHARRIYFGCVAFRPLYHGLSYYSDIAIYWQDEMTDPTVWQYHYSVGSDYFLFPILTPPDTTTPVDPIIPEPGDTLTTGYLILHSGNTLVVAPGDTLVIGGDTLVVTGDTLVVTLGDTLVLGGSTFVVNPGDTLFVNPGDTLFVSPDGSVTVLPGSTAVVHSGSGSSSGGDDPGVAIRQADMLYRYTAVSPNPATQRATVTSSFGLERIEVYDPQGRQTLTLPATGYRVTLDLSAWPRGTYLLRITTPLGPTTKKLLVQ